MVRRSTTALTASTSGSSNDRNRRAAAWLLFPLGGIVGLGATRRKSRRHSFVPGLVLSTCALLIFLGGCNRNTKRNMHGYGNGFDGGWNTRDAPDPNRSLKDACVPQKPFEQLSGAA